jgi:hypothetical protein
MRTVFILALVVFMPLPTGAQEWGAFKRDSCVRLGLRQYSSRLENIPWTMSWQGACEQTPATVENTYFRTPSRCVNTGLTGEWGEFDVPDSSCAPQWGAFQRDSCRAIGVRQYSSRVDIPQGIDIEWKDACEQTPATVENTYFRTPSRCVNTGLTGEWGEFDVPDSSCAPQWGAFQRDSCRANGVRQYSSRLYIPQGIDPETACKQTPATVANVFFGTPSRCVNTGLTGEWGEFDVRDSTCNDPPTNAPFGSKMALLAHEGYGTLGPYQYVRVRSDGSVYIAPIDGMTETDATDAEFKKVNGLSDNACFSFESTKYPGRFLHHANGEIRLDSRPWNRWFFSFNDSATFCLRIPKGGASEGYESFDMKDHFFRAEGSALVLR